MQRLRSFSQVSTHGSPREPYGAVAVQTLDHRCTNLSDEADIKELGESHLGASTKKCYTENVISVSGILSDLFHFLLCSFS